VQFQLEPIAFSPVHSLWQSLEVIDDAGRDNVGMVIDFWHLYAGGETTPDDVAKLDKSVIYGVHFCDGVAHEEGTEWDEPALRGYLAGEGEIPVQEWVDAVLATGFDGVWSSELLSTRHWEWDLWELAVECRHRLEQYVST
jgi:sugar phosphate isomerase/epimerase